MASCPCAGYHIVVHVTEANKGQLHIGHHELHTCIEISPACIVVSFYPVTNECGHTDIAAPEAESKSVPICDCR
eukprot:6414583-Amphidinium_carterae.5